MCVSWLCVTTAWWMAGCVTLCKPWKVDQEKKRETCLVALCWQAIGGSMGISMPCSLLPRPLWGSKLIFSIGCMTGSVSRQVSIFSCSSQCKLAVLWAAFGDLSHTIECGGSRCGGPICRPVFTSYTRDSCSSMQKEFDNFSTYYYHLKWPVFLYFFHPKH